MAHAVSGIFSRATEVTKFADAQYVDSAPMARSSQHSLLTLLAMIALAIKDFLNICMYVFVVIDQ
jgi:hypothetical protein